MHVHVLRRSSDAAKGMGTRGRTHDALVDICMRMGMGMGMVHGHGHGTHLVNMLCIMCMGMVHGSWARA